MKSSNGRFEVFSTARGAGSFGFAEGGRPGTIPPRNSIALRSIAAFFCAGLFCFALWLEERPRLARVWFPVSAVLLGVCVSKFAIGRYIS